MNGTTNPKMTATQNRISSQREGNSGVIATFISQFPPIQPVCMRRLETWRHGNTRLAADPGTLSNFEQSLHRFELRLALFLDDSDEDWLGYFEEATWLGNSCGGDLCPGGRWLSQTGHLNRKWRIRFLHELPVWHKFSDFCG